MEELKIFENPAFGKIRALTLGGEPWFVGKDVCVTFGDTNPNRSLGRVDEQDKMRYVIQTAGGSQEATLINESGLYSLLFSMQPEKANKGGTHTVPPSVQERIDKLHAFKRWVTSEVLPAIRKTGGYIAGAGKMTDAEIMAQAVLVANRTIKARDAAANPAPVAEAEA